MRYRVLSSLAPFLIAGITAGSAASAQDDPVEGFWDQMGQQAGNAAQAYSDYWAERQLWKDKAAAAREELERCGGCASAQAELDKWTGIENEFQDTAGQIMMMTGQSPLVAQWLGIGPTYVPEVYEIPEELRNHAGLSPDMTYAGHYLGQTIHIPSAQLISEYACTVSYVESDRYEFNCTDRTTREAIHASGTNRSDGFLVEWDGGVTVNYLGQPATGKEIEGLGYRNGQLRFSLKKTWTPTDRPEDGVDTAALVSSAPDPSGTATDATVVAAAAKAPPPVPTEPVEVFTGGDWEGILQCPQVKVGLNVAIVSEDGRNVVTRLRFYATPESPGVLPGEIEMTGQIVPNRGDLFLQPSKWIVEPPSFFPTFGMRANVDLKGTGNLTGKLPWPGCEEEFTLDRLTKG